MRCRQRRDMPLNAHFLQTEKDAVSYETHGLSFITANTHKTQNIPSSIINEA